MPEPAPTRDLRRVVACFAIGVAATALAAAGGIAAALGGWLAQPAFALAVRGWRGTGGAAGEPAGARLKRDLSALGVAWAGVLLLVGVLVAWPLSSLRESGSLGATLALSAVAGLSLIGLWRLWPLWHGIERDGGALARHWQALGERDASTWLGLAAAACLAAVVATVLLLAWPGLLSRETRWLLAGACVVGWPMLHLLLQRLPSATALPLQVVEMTGDPAAVDLAAEDGEDPEVALYAAARRGRVDRALELLEAGASPDALPPADDRDQRALPVLAAVLPDLRLLRALIGRGVDVNAPHAGMTPLIAATRDSWHGRPEAVMTLLANGADPRARDRDGNTPLHHAARSSDPGVAALLRDASAELDTCNDDGVTPLGIACAAGNWRLARFLLERGARAEVPSASPALLSAAGGEDDDAAGVQLLLKHKARVDARDRDQRTALHEAAFAGHAEIAGVLLAAGADVAARDIHGLTPLLEAARGGRLAAFEVLVAAKAAFDVTDGEQRGALLLAARAETASPPLLRRLLELGADVEARDRDGRRALDHAAEAGRWSLVAVLDPAYALPLSVAPDADDGTLADRAPIDLLRDGLREGRAAQLDALAGLLSPAELGALLVDDDGTPPTPVQIEWLMAHGADPDVLRADGDTPVFALLSEGPAALPALQAMLRLGVSPAGAGGLARFLSACASDDVAGRGLEQCALDLMARGADPFAPSPDGEPVPGLAVRLGWPRLLQRLIDTGVGLDARDARGMTALHLAAALGRDAALKTLVAHGASPDVRAADGQTPLGVALSAGRRDLADWLDWRGWPLPGRALRPDDLPAAAVAGDTDALRRLLDLGFDVDATDAQGCTALLRAAGGGHADAVSLLLARGADVRRAASTGATPLSAAVSMRHAAIVDRLLAAGATLEQRLPGEVTVLMLAAALGLPDLCARLLTAGADIEATDAQGLTPLHCASLFAFTARDRPRLTTLMDTLLLGGADVDAAAAGGVTPLLLLLGARAEPGTACDEDALIGGLEQLLDEGASLDVQDPRGFGPLHLAALHGLLRTTQRLLRAGADPDLRDALNRTPREIAVMRGFVDVAGEFTPLQSGVSMARFLREPR